MSGCSTGTTKSDTFKVVNAETVIACNLIVRDGIGSIVQRVETVGGGISNLVEDPDLDSLVQMKSLVAGANMSIIDNGTTLTFASASGTGGGTVTNLTSVGGQTSILQNGAASDIGPGVAIRTFAAGTGISLGTTADVITINASVPAAIQTLQSTGAGNSILPVTPVSTSTVNFKSLIAGTNISFVDSGSDITINSTASGGGGISTFNCVVPVGLEQTIFQNGVVSDTTSPVTFRNMAGTANQITVTPSANALTYSVPNKFFTGSTQTGYTSTGTDTNLVVLSADPVITGASAHKNSLVVGRHQISAKVDNTVVMNMLLAADSPATYPININHNFDGCVVNIAGHGNTFSSTGYGTYTGSIFNLATLDAGNVGAQNTVLQKLVVNRSIITGAGPRIDSAGGFEFDLVDSIWNSHSNTLTTSAESGTLVFDHVGVNGEFLITGTNFFGVELGNTISLSQFNGKTQLSLDTWELPDTEEIYTFGNLILNDDLAKYSNSTILGNFSSGDFYDDINIAPTSFRKTYLVSEGNLFIHSPDRTTFTGVCPQTSIAPTIGDHLTNKTYVDAVVAGSGTGTPIGTNYQITVTPAGPNNVFSVPNKFFTGTTTTGYLSTGTDTNLVVLSADPVISGALTHKNSLVVGRHDIRGKLDNTFISSMIQSSVSDPLTFPNWITANHLFDGCHVQISGTNGFDVGSGTYTGCSFNLLNSANMGAINSLDPTDFIISNTSITGCGFRINTSGGFSLDVGECIFNTNKSATDQNQFNSSGSINGQLGLYSTVFSGGLQIRGTATTFGVSPDNYIYSSGFYGKTRFFMDGWEQTGTDTEDIYTFGNLLLTGDISRFTNAVVLGYYDGTLVDNFYDNIGAVTAQSEPKVYLVSREKMFIHADSLIQFTGVCPQTSIAPTIGDHLTNKTYVDSQLSSSLHTTNFAMGLITTPASAGEIGLVGTEWFKIRWSFVDPKSQNSGGFSCNASGFISVPSTGYYMIDCKCQAFGEASNLTSQPKMRITVNLVEKAYHQTRHAPENQDFVNGYVSGIVHVSNTLIDLITIEMRFSTTSQDDPVQLLGGSYFTIFKLSD